MLVPYQGYKTDEHMQGQFEKAFHVRMPNGEYLRAGKASLFILEKLGWNWRARMLMYLPLIWLVELAYIIIANNRDFFARFMFRSENT